MMRILSLALALLLCSTVGCSRSLQGQLLGNWEIDPNFKTVESVFGINGYTFQPDNQVVQWGMIEDFSIGTIRSEAMPHSTTYNLTKDASGNSVIEIFGESLFCRIKEGHLILQYPQTGRILSFHRISGPPKQIKITKFY